jgi:hypothetical protein
MAFPNNCNPRIINVDATTGCTLTRASILAMTPQVFENQGYTETKMDEMITRSTMARVAGVNEIPLMTLLNSRIKDLGKDALNKVKIAGSPSVIQPYIYRRQRRNINSNYWRVVSSAATPGAGSGNLHPGSWDYTVAVSLSPWASNLANIEQYFLPGSAVLIEGLSAANVAYSPNFVITASVAASSTTAKVTMAPNVTATGWAGLTAAQQAAYQLTSGLVITMANSVSDFESYSQEYNAENTNKLLTFWVQTSRFAYEYNDEYLKALESSLTSGYFHEFRELPLAQQLKIKRQKWDRDLLNSFWNGNLINENQTVETYASLPRVVDVANPTCVVEYKANALGIDTQLGLCGRTMDLQGGALNMDSLFAIGYGIKRAREADGTSIDTIDFMTNRFSAGQIMKYMVNLMKLAYGVTYMQYIEPMGKITFNGDIMLNFQTYDLPPDLGGYKLAIFWDPYFDDKISATDPANQTRAVTLWGIDWTDVLWGLLATNSAKRVTNVADKLYFDVIMPVMHRAFLESTTWTTIIDDPARHLIVKNFQMTCPTGSVAGCSPQAG